jgi:uncharacterized membrane protein
MVLAAIDPGTALWIQVLVIVAVFVGVLLVRPKSKE